MRHTKDLFKIYFIGIVIVLFVLFCTYRYIFNGNLSSDISDWTAFVNIFNGVGMLLLTALNVWIFYKLTVLIAENEEKHRLCDKQKEALNNLNTGIPNSNSITFSASSSNEVAHQYEGKSHSLFTYFLLKKLQETAGNVTMGELFEYIKENVSRTSVTVIKKSQTPTIVAGNAVVDWENRTLQ